MNTYYYYYRSPIGKLLLAGDGNCLNLLGLPSGSMAREHQNHWVKDSVPFREAISQLEKYFSGELRKFNLILAPKGTTFQKSVWEALTLIPYGETWSYGQLASYIGKPKASRAVGAANGVNPIPIIIPCHRVIGANGKLTGFGGGLQMKNSLLTLESTKK